MGQEGPGGCQEAATKCRPLRRCCRQELEGRGVRLAGGGDALELRVCTGDQEVAPAAAGGASFDV